MRKQTRILVASAVVLAVGAAAAMWLRAPKDNPEVVAATAQTIRSGEGADASLVLVPESPNGGLVIYAHGNGQTENDLLTGRNVSVLTARLLESGYTVAASRAAGNAWGNATSVDIYTQLVDDILDEHLISDVFFVAESMGALSAMQVAPSVDAAAVVAMYPVCDIDSMLTNDRYADGIAAAWGDVVSVPKLASSAPMMIWASREDTRVPFDRNAAVCAGAAEALGADVTLIETEGEHGDPSNFDPEAVVSFFDAH